MMDCLSDRLTTPDDVSPDDDLDSSLTSPGLKTLMNSSDRSNLQMIDFDPFVDGELLLAAPATASQQEIWLGVQISQEANLACILSQSLQAIGRLDLEVLQAAIRQLVSRHESLRTTISGDGMTILIAKEIDLQVPLSDLSALSANDRAAEIDRYQSQSVSEPFDLQHGPLFRARILKLTDREHLLIFAVHHIVCDGWSLGIILADLAKIYTALNRGLVPELAPAEYFSEYAFLEQAQIDDPETIATEAYWLQRFAELPPGLDLPTDYPRPPLRTFNADREYHTLPASLVERIEKVGFKNGCSLMTTLLSAFEILLFKLTGQTDLTVGVPTSGQIAAGKYNLVGHCVNFLPLRSRIDPAISFSDYLRSRNSAILDDYEHQNFTFGSLLQKLAIPRDASRIPLVSAVFNIDLDGGGSPSTFDELTTELTVNRGAFATFEFFLNGVTTASGDLDLDCQYNPNLFRAISIQRRLGEFENLLTQIVATPDRPLHQLSLLSAAQAQQLLVDWNATQTDYPQSQWIDRLFEQQVAIAGDAVALVFQSQQLTYRELNDRANRLANYLLAIGVKSGELVGIALDRSIETIVSILAILKAGGAYLPLDLSYPAERLAFMLENARVSVLVTKKTVRDRLPSHPARTIDLDTDWDDIAQASPNNPQRSGQADDLAYVMYTSGSTGQPKGVCIPHRGVVRLVKNTNYLDFSPQQVWLQLAPIAFDASTLEIWGSLLNGGKLVLFPGEKPSLSELGQTIAHHQITTLWLTAGLFHLMVDERIEDLQPLRQLIAGGDVLSVPHVRKVLATLPDCQLINGYGPTENTTFTCCYPISSLEGLTSVPIGRPIANTQVYVLDPDLQPVPIGISGELYIGGDGLARGYLDRDELNREKFVPDPFAPGERLYRTGDLVRYLPDGNLEFLGRIDTQVKIRGFRIELGEIDAILAQHPAVREVRTIDREDRPGDKRLVAYIVSDRPTPPSAQELRTFIQSKLPDYLIPSAFVTISALPLTANGKVDRRALPVPESDRPDTAHAFVAARNDLELHLVKIWERVLGVNPIGVRDNFFELGGHSLMAVRLFNEIEKELGEKISLSTLFNVQTIEELSVLVAPKEESATTWQSLVQIKPGDTESPPLFCIHALWGNILFYRDFSQYLETNRPIYGLQSKGLDGEQKPYDSIPEMAASYIKEIQSVQPQGPYFLLGFSLGGLIAFEIALQLQAQGQEIQMLTLIDPTCPNLASSSSEHRAFKLDASLLTKVIHHLQALGKLGLEDQITYIREKVHWNLTVGKVNFFHKIYLRYIKKSINELRQIDVVLANDLSRKVYVPDNLYSGKIILLKAEDPGIDGDDDSDPRWELLATEGIDIELVPGSHLNMMKEPNIRTLCAKFNYFLNQY
jgi:amino acid adenylation domain-containing protein